jgi:hypothetical protein
VRCAPADKLTSRQSTTQSGSSGGGGRRESEIFRFRVFEPRPTCLCACVTAEPTTAAAAAERVYKKTPLLIKDKEAGLTIKDKKRQNQECTVNTVERNRLE